MKKILAVALTVASFLTVIGTANAAEEVLFGFEGGSAGWAIPDWALNKEGYVCKKIEVSNDTAAEGKAALKADVKFPGGSWAAGYAEIQQYFDWTPYAAVSVDVYLPETAPAGLKAKLILTVGESWIWAEMAKGTALEPGKWVTVTANLLPGSSDFRAKVDDAFRKNVHKAGVRIESDTKPAYDGVVYIDNFRVNKEP
jgi:hypothetical protein